MRRIRRKDSLDDLWRRTYTPTATAGDPIRSMNTANVNSGTRRHGRFHCATSLSKRNRVSVAALMATAHAIPSRCTYGHNSVVSHNASPIPNHVKRYFGLYHQEIGDLREKEREREREREREGGGRGFAREREVREKGYTEAATQATKGKRGRGRGRGMGGDLWNLHALHAVGRGRLCVWHWLFSSSLREKL